jgi:hypothetical protein
MYEFLKITAAKRLGKTSQDQLPTYQAAMCGSVAGAISAMVTTPLDLIKTRLNLRPREHLAERGSTKAGVLVMDEVRHIYAESGWRGFFCGALIRAAWMGLGGFIFLGSFELAKDCLTLPPCKKRETTLQTPHVVTREYLGEQPPAHISFLAGLFAGICVDVPLHPVDTIKTRLQGPKGFQANGGYRGLWNGLSAVLLTSVPGSAIFFVVYPKRFVVHFA